MLNFFIGFAFFEAGAFFGFFVAAHTFLRFHPEGPGSGADL